MGQALKNGSRGDDVKSMQEKLVQLGFDITPDGIFGDGTETTVKKLQTVFGYTVDGIVGEGTLRLMDAQIGYGWNAKAPDAQERALRAQGKNDEADALAKKRKAAEGGSDSKAIKEKGNVK